VHVAVGVAELLWSATDLAGRDGALNAVGDVLGGDFPLGQVQSLALVGDANLEGSAGGFGWGCKGRRAIEIMLVWGLKGAAVVARTPEQERP
jgi:hypothetical protein